MKVIAVTNRKLCDGNDDFFNRIETLANLNFYAIMLREKDLNLKSFNFYSRKCSEICKKHNVKLIINTFTDAAIENGIPYLHLSFNHFINLPDNKKKCFTRIGVSVHSVEEAVEACQNGADYLIAGHIFSTSCKPDVPPRGTEFLKNVCQSVSIPVFGIGGITPQNAPDVISSGADGVCIMSPSMTLDKKSLENYKSLTAPAN